MLDRKHPGCARFPNRKSATISSEFVWEELTQLRQTGVLKTPEEVGLSEEDIKLIMGLAVVTNRKRKQRLIWDGR